MAIVSYIPWHAREGDGSSTLTSDWVPLVHHWLICSTTAGKACNGIRQQQGCSLCNKAATVVSKCTQLPKLSHLFTALRRMLLFFLLNL